MDNSRRWLALDVGGANLKAAHSGGAVRSEAFELWKHPARLASALVNLAGRMPAADAVALTMTAELCDCFANKAEGVLAVLDAAENAFGATPIRVWCVDEAFRTPGEVRGRPLLAAAANWLALAGVAARLVAPGPGVLIDIGSTTADLIPLAGGAVAAAGRTDLERLRSGELVYAGVRRTPVCALATELPLRGSPVGLAAELFATTLDVYLTLGEWPENPSDLATADGRPATAEAARDRLARMVGADRESFSRVDARQLAQAADEALLSRLIAAARRACGAAIGEPLTAVVAGSGSFLAERVARRLLGAGGRVVDLGAEWGTEQASAGCAWALAILATERDGDGR